MGSVKDAGRRKPGLGGTAFFLALAAALCAAAYVAPGLFLPARVAIPWLLGLAMLGMGLTLTPADFSGVLKRPRAVAAGSILQFTIMPSLAWVLARAFSLSPEEALGVVLVGSCPGGTASNVLSYLARADVALSVTLTAVTTIAAPLATPALVYFLAGEWIQVPVAGLFFGAVEIIVLPVLAGVSLRAALGERVDRIVPALAPATSAVIALIIAIILAGAKGSLGAAVLPLAAAVALHNGLGFALGYWLARAARQEEQSARTISIEVGIQNSGLAVALASTLFSPAVALPAAIFSLWQNLAGALLASYWSRREPAGLPLRGDPS